MLIRTLDHWKILSSLTHNWRNRLTVWSAISVSLYIYNETEYCIYCKYVLRTTGHWTSDLLTMIHNDNTHSFAPFITLLHSTLYYLNNNESWSWYTQVYCYSSDQTIYGRWWSIVKRVCFWDRCLKSIEITGLLAFFCSALLFHIIAFR